MEVTVLRSKRRFFAKYFEVYFNTSSSVAVMSKRRGYLRRGEARVFKERKRSLERVKAKKGSDTYGRETTPSANPAIKAHEPLKDFPARLITSHINAPQEALSSLLNKILQPYIEKANMYAKTQSNLSKS